MGKQRKHNLKILKLLVLSLMIPFPCELQPAGELQEIILEIYCERWSLILEDIEIIFFEKKLTCDYAVVVLSISVMILVLHM